MRRFWIATGALTVTLAIAMVATFPTALGQPLWHYHAAFAVILTAALLARRRLQDRRVATLSMAFMGIVASATGFAMLYTTQMPSKEWVTWWHSVTSFALLLAFLVHWLHNHSRLWGFTKRMFTRGRAPGFAAAAAWIGILAAGLWTWTPSIAARFTSGNYLYLSSWAILVCVALVYGVWLAYRIPRVHARLADTRHRNRARALVDTSLFLAHWGALLTGFVLLWFATPLRGGPLKYVSKWWHTATSVAFLALVALHIGFNVRLVAAHARRLDADMAR